MARRGQITEETSDILKIPEPIVILNEVACKGLKLLDDGKLMLLGLENGEVKVADRNSFSIYS